MEKFMNRGYRYSVWMVMFLAACGCKEACADTLNPEALKLAVQWEKIKFEVQDPATQREKMDQLGEEADAMAEKSPNNHEVVLWDAIITSERASMANEAGGVSGPLAALKYASQAKNSLEKMDKLDPKAFEAAAPTSLGVLYYRVPPFPLGFGDKKKARHLLEEAVKNAPTGLDAHYFYGDFLYEQGEYAKAAEVLEKSLSFPHHPERPIWDKNRRLVIQELLEKAKAKSEKQ
jgi:tetratricopeptide (TPR) repeat protein